MIVSTKMPTTALVTGAAYRIGRTIALDLAAAGWTVALHCHRSFDEAKRLAEEITGRGGRAEVFRADLMCEEETSSLIATVVRTIGPLGCLINNASVFEPDDAASVTRASWDAHMESNLRAPFVLMQGFAHHLPDDAEGVIINLLDQRVWNLTPGFTSYTLSKAGLWTLTQTLALALAPRIRVNGIGPGPALPSPRQSSEEFLRQCDVLPLKHGTSPDEICVTVRFILSSPSMTGQMIALDGGQHLCWAPSTGMLPIE